MSGVFEKVEAVKKKYPEESIEKLCKRAGVHPSSYYYARKKQGLAKSGKAEKKKSSPKYTKLVAEPAVESGKVMMIYGTPEQVRAVIGSLS